MCYFCNLDFFKLGGFIISILTLILAWRIYKNFDIKKSFINEQLKVVCALSNDLYKLGLNTNLLSAGRASRYFRFFDFFDRNENDKKYSEIYFSTFYTNEVLPFIEYRHNLLLPKNISEVIEQFDIKSTKPTVEKDLPQSYTFIFSQNHENNEDIYCYLYMDYDEFYDLTKRLIKEITKWLNDFGATDINFPDHMYGV